MARSVGISTSLAPGPTRRDGSGWPGVAVERRPRETVSWRFSNPGEMPEFCDPFRGRPEILVVAFRGSRRLDRPATFWHAYGLRSRAFGFSPRLNGFTRFGCGAMGQRRPTLGGWRAGTAMPYLGWMARWDSDALPLGGWRAGTALIVRQDGSIFLPIPSDERYEIIPFRSLRRVASRVNGHRRSTCYSHVAVSRASRTV